ncbi:MAG: helix-turn-helix transcriptional regulator [Proteobacteria bacterium]|nr:helix-turn-helix transcriptional regulator [Pseudomonadota bacterium]
MKAVTWSEIREKVCDADELARIERRNEVMRKLLARRAELKLSQKDVERISGVKQPVISRMERAVTSAQLDTFFDVLDALHLRMELVPIDDSRS